MLFLSETQYVLIFGPIIYIRRLSLTNRFIFRGLFFHAVPRLLVLKWRISFIRYSKRGMSTELK